ncbi:MAG: hypothetical protein AB2A00_28530 [Myxococcota bacterium]
MSTRALLLTLTTTLLALSCTSSLPLPAVPTLSERAREQVDESYRRRDYALRQSMYFGPFFDDPNLVLVAPKPFDELALLTLPGGRNIAPGPVRGILPAGTRIRIERIELPTTGTVLGRPLLAPRYNPWIVFRVNRFDVDNPHFQDIRHVVVLPFHVTDPEQLERAVDVLFAPEDYRDWLRQRSPQVRSAIEQKQAMKGMTLAELTAALGMPDRTTREPESPRSTAYFGRRAVTLENDVVVGVE